MIQNTAAEENNNTHHIHFDEEVNVHVHTVELGDHPDACHGAPVQLGWRYSTRTSLLHDHTSKPVECISQTQREDALIDCGVPRLHIHRAIVQAHRIRLSRIDSFNKSQRILSSSSSSSSSSSITTNKEKHATTPTKKHHTATSGVKREYRKSRSAPTFPSVKNSTSTKPRPEEFKKKIYAFVRTFPLHTKR